MERKLELKDICGYLPYGLEFAFRDTYKLLGKDFTLNKNGFFHNGIPILRPLSDLYKTITHNGKEIVPIVECAKICYKKAGYDAILKGKDCFVVNNEKAILIRFAWDISHLSFYADYVMWDGKLYINDKPTGIHNQVEIFDYLHELKIDYRGLIDAGLAVDVNTLNKNPYK